MNLFLPEIYFSSNTATTLMEYIRTFFITTEVVLEPVISHCLILRKVVLRIRVYFFRWTNAKNAVSSMCLIFIYSGACLPDGLFLDGNRRPYHRY